MADKMETNGEARGLAGVGPKPVNPVDTPAAGASPAPGAPVEKGGTLETEVILETQHYEQYREKMREWLPASHIIMEITYDEGEAWFRVMKLPSVGTRAVLRGKTTPSRSVLVATLAPSSRNVDVAAKCFFDAAAVRDPFAAASALATAIALLYDLSSIPLHVEMVMRKDEYVVEVVE